MQPEVKYTYEQLLEIIRQRRQAMEDRLQHVELPPVVGEEQFLPTAEGQVRILAYNTKSPGVLPLFVNLHGSGFVVGHAEMDDPYMPDMASKAQIRVWNVDYSLSPEYPFPKAINEVYAVIRYARENAAELGIDPDRIALGGHSAGGNFTAAVALMDQDGKALGLRGLILDYPPLDVYTDIGLKKGHVDEASYTLSRTSDACYLNDKEGRKNPLISPLFATADQLAHWPPTLVIAAGLDILCDENERFSRVLAAAGVDVTYRCFQHNQHGFTHQDVPEAAEAWQMMTDFLIRHLWGAA